MARPEIRQKGRAWQLALEGRVVDLEDGGPGGDAATLDGLDSTAFQTRDEKNAANGYAGLNSSGRVDVSRMASGTPDGTKFVRDDGILATPAGGGTSTAVDVSIADAGGNYVATNVETALAEEADARQAHEADTSAAHAASAISYAGATGISATDVEAAIDEVASERATATDPTVTGNLTLQNGALTSRFRFRTGNPGLDLDMAGTSMYFTIFANADFSGASHQLFRFDPSGYTAVRKPFISEGGNHDLGDSSNPFGKGYFMSLGSRSGAADPTAADVTSSTFMAWKNTTSGESAIWVNDGGTMKKVPLGIQYLTQAGGDALYSPLGHAHNGLVPTGGTTGQVLKKASTTNYDYSWQTDETGAGGGGYTTIQEDGGGLTGRTTLNFAANILAADNAGSTRTDVSVPDSSETVKGVIERATVAETTTGTDTDRATTPAGVKAVADTKALTTRAINTTAPLSGGGDLSADRTLSVAVASETASGVVELATAVETTTGTDAARAVHPAGLKAHLDARPTPYEITFLASAVAAILNDVAAALAEHNTLKNMRQAFNMTNYTQARLLVNVSKIPVSGTPRLRVQFLDGTSTWRYLDNTSGPSVNLTPVGLTKSSWITLHADAKAERDLRLVTIDGAGANSDPEIKTVTLQLR